MSKRFIIPVVALVVIVLSLTSVRSALTEEVPPPALAKLNSDATGALEITWNPLTNTPSFIQGQVELQKLGLQARTADPQAVAFTVLERHGELLGIRSAGELRLESEVSDPLGMSHVTLAQVYQGVEVYGGTVKVHVSADGQSLVAISNSFVPGVGLPVVQSNVSAEAALGEARKILPDGVAQGDPKLVVYPDRTKSGAGASARLAWIVELRDDELPARNVYVIDALQGHLLATLNLLYDSVPTTNEPEAPPATREDALRNTSPGDPLSFSNSDLLRQTFAEPTMIQAFLDQQHSSLASYRTMLNSDAEVSAAQVLIVASLHEDWSINPQVLLAYLEWRWHLVTTSGATPEQIDTTVIVRESASADLLTQMTELADELWRQYVAHAGDPSQASKALASTLGDEGAQSFIRVYSDLFVERNSGPTILATNTLTMTGTFRKPFDGRYDVNSFFDTGPSGDGNITRLEGRVISGTLTNCTLGKAATTATMGLTTTLEQGQTSEQRR